MPVIWEFFTAAQACNIGASELRRRRKPLAGPFGNRKAETLVTATEQDIEQTRHNSPPPNFGSPMEAFNLPTQVALYYRTCPNVHISSHPAVLLH